jgi:hypothetical protein
MAIPSGWVFQVDGYSEGSYFNSTKGRAQTQSIQKALTASVGSHLEGGGEEGGREGTGITFRGNRKQQTRKMSQREAA